MNEDLREFEETGLITPERMRAVDKNAISLGVEGLCLMESAGAALAGVALRYSPDVILILCGSGNNGGDGFVAARHLQREAEVHVVYPKDGVKTPDALSSLEKLRHCAVSLHPVSCPGDVRDLSGLYEGAGVIIDAILGTGGKGNLREPYLSMVETLSISCATLISADLPTSGITPDVVCGFHRTKVHGSEKIDIGIPLEAEIFTGPGDLTMIPKKDSSAHKGTGGRVLVIGGGPYQGAPYLAGMAALRAGADIVRVASPVVMQCPDIIVERLDGPCVSESHLEDLIGLIGDSDVVVCGCGLGEKSHDVVTKAAPYMKKAVFDADALRKPLPSAVETIYTPHTGELERILGYRASGTLYEKAKSLKDLGGGLVENSTILLKGETDIISDGSRVRFNRTGHPGMTTGGTGDVLAGICGALLCRLPAFESACIGTYINGCAGMAAGLERGDGMIATDLLEKIPSVILGDN
ncbi:MAG: NAD(P)H-hydrate dehydratase [Methanomicrobiaceae archaeon]|nr:NAD(P)H-hydrate dehydratase [Methanomicrobiaceae archaeon]